MRRSVLVLAGFVFMVLMFSGLGSRSAYAQLSAGNQTGGDACPGATTVDECFYSTSIVGGWYSSCTAYNRMGDVCYDVVTIGTRRQCGGVNFSAHCACDTVKLTTRGYCSYIPSGLR